MSIGESDDVVTACGELSADDDIDCINAAGTDFVGAIGAAMIACAAARRGKPIATIIEPFKRQPREFCREVGLWDRIRNPLPKGRFDYSSDTLKIRQLHALDPSFTEALANLLATNVSGFTATTSHLVKLCLNETLQNVFEYASSAIGCFVIGRWHVRSGNLRIAVVDGGRGIVDSLRDVPEYVEKSDQELVRDAVLVQGVTSRANRVGGFGLKTIRETVTEREGRLVVLTGKIRLSADTTGIRTESAPQWRGTAIEIDFRPTVRVESVVEEIF